MKQIEKDYHRSTLQAPLIVCQKKNFLNHLCLDFFFFEILMVESGGAA